jgi:hypothetical protein
MLLEISVGRRVKIPSEIYPPGVLLQYTLRDYPEICAAFGSV